MGAGKKIKSSAGLEILTGGIAHDLNTVITTIYGYCELALESAGDNTGSAKSIQAIISAADRAKLLTGQLLDLSRNASIEKVPVPVADALKDTINFISPSVPEGIRIILNLKTPDAWVMAPPALLFRIFLNLATNAIQAMRNKGGTLTITVENGDEAEGEGTAPTPGRLLISFSDTGTGMDEQTAGEIFKPFFTAGSHSGTGLGLTVVADSVRDLGGTVDFVTAPGSGTTFRIIIPDPFFGPLPEKD